MSSWSIYACQWIKSGLWLSTPDVYLRNYIITHCGFADCQAIQDFSDFSQSLAMWFWWKNNDFLTSENGEHLGCLIIRPNIWQNGFQDVVINNKKYQFYIIKHASEHHEISVILFEIVAFGCFKSTTWVRDSVPNTPALRGLCEAMQMNVKASLHLMIMFVKIIFWICLVLICHSLSMVLLK